MGDLEKAEILINKGENKEAWNLLNQVLTKNPKNERAWLLAFNLAPASKRNAILEKAKVYLPRDSFLFAQVLSDSWLQDQSPPKPNRLGRAGLILFLILAIFIPVLFTIPSILRVTGVSNLVQATPLEVNFDNLASLLIQGDDLPEDYSPGSISDIAPEMFRDVPAAEFKVFQSISNNGERAGGVAVFYFKEDAVAVRAFSLITDGWTSLEYKGAIQSWEPDHLGDDALALIYNEAWFSDDTGTPPFFKFSEIAFYKCNAFFHIRLGGISDFGWLSSYAIKLENRYTPLVCR